MIINVLADVADFQLENLLHRTIVGTIRAVSEGEWLGGIVRDGHHVNSGGNLKNNNNPILGQDTSEADVVRLVFELIAIIK